MKQDGGPAFPQNGDRVFPDTGMSLRDYFAGIAISALAIKDRRICEDIAKEAYQFADAMIAEREKE